MWADVMEQAASHAARRHGVKVVRLAGWRTRGHGKTAGRLLGTMVHDTVTPPSMTDGRLFALLRDGYVGLSGPIANVGLGRDGTLCLVAAGRAYHAGSGSWPGIPSGNLNTLGVEAANRGLGSGERWTQKQFEVCRTFLAEVHRAADVPASRCVGHKEWTSRKVDPWSIDMATFRRQLGEEVKADDVALTDNEKQALAAIPQLVSDVAWIKRALGPHRYDFGAAVDDTQLTVGHDLLQVRRQTAGLHERLGELAGGGDVADGEV